MVKKLFISSYTILVVLLSSCTNELQGLNKSPVFCVDDVVIESHDFVIPNSNTIACYAYIIPTKDDLLHLTHIKKKDNNEYQYSLETDSLNKTFTCVVRFYDADYNPVVTYTEEDCALYGHIIGKSKALPCVFDEYKFSIPEIEMEYAYAYVKYEYHIPRNGMSVECFFTWEFIIDTF